MALVIGVLCGYCIVITLFLTLNYIIIYDYYGVHVKYDNCFSTVSGLGSWLSLGAHPE